MKLDDFINSLKEKCSEISILCAIHMIKKRYDIEEMLEKNELKELLTNYDNYDKLLNDYANVIYNRYESSKDEVYKELCDFYNENSDNKSLFEHRLKRIINQDPTKYLSMEDDDMKKAAILRVEDKIKIIENSFYYQNNKEFSSKEIEKLKKSLEIVKTVVGLR